MGLFSQVKNRAPAPIQITAEQLLREAQERGVEINNGATQPNLHITDPDELNEYRMRKRKEYEDEVRRNRMHIGTWIKYARFEEDQKEYKRCRSVYERALEIDYKDRNLWLKYAEMEMRNKFINHARNVWDRCCTLLPRIDQFWYKYAFMEELAGNIGSARQVFERWMQVSDSLPRDTLTARHTNCTTH
jgi:crooked neck